MNDGYILIFFLILILISFSYNIFYINPKKHNIEPLFIECIAFLAILISLINYFIFKHEKYQKDPDMYNYNQENPNALIKGKNISGTVYSSYPEGVPGLGWIL